MKQRVLVTCPPMLRAMGELSQLLSAQGWEVTCPEVVQTLDEATLFDLVPRHDGWIIGDDPATRRVFEAGKRGSLRAIVKWGVGVDNVDFVAARELGIQATNTPHQFGAEVADVATAYVIGLARALFTIDRGVRSGSWPKPAGVSLRNKTVALAGFGDIGRNTACRLLAADMKVIAYDPAFRPSPGLEAVECAGWPDRVEEADFLVLTCALNAKNRHMVDAGVLARVRPGLRVVNVARGPLIDEAALITALGDGRVHSAALDVFECEPLPADSPLRSFENCIFGSHNASNTLEAVRRTSERAVELLAGFLAAS